jgi:hypothetical protein
MVVHDLDGVRQQIREAFPPSPFRGSITTCDCQECLDLRAALSNKRWDEVPTEFLDVTCSPTLLNAKAYQAFLPAYMLLALGDVIGGSAVLEFKLYSLCPEVHENDDQHAIEYRNQYLKERAALMTLAQVQAIKSFLLFVAAHANGGALLPLVGPALENTWR